MPKQLQKSLQDYLSKVKKHNPNNHQSSSSSSSFQPTKNWILSGCKHPKTLSFAFDRNQNNRSTGNSNNNTGSSSNNNNGAAATLADVDRFLYENFKSLYIKEDHEDYYSKRGSEDHDHRTLEANNNYKSRGILFGSPRFLEPPTDLCGSHRFFVAPGLSSSLMEEARLSLTATSDDVGSGSSSNSTSTATLNDQSSTVSNDSTEVKLPEDCIAVLTYSPSPYDDFRRSMQEMVEARMQRNEKVDWDFMEDLLFYYLNLNDRKSYKFILSAFADLVVVLRGNSNKIPARPRSFRISNQRRRKIRNM